MNYDSSSLFPGDDIWKYVGKLTEAQRSMIDDRFKWKVGIYLCSLCLFFVCHYLTVHDFQAREMDKRKEGKPGEARAALRRSVRENGCVFYLHDFRFLLVSSLIFTARFYVLLMLLALVFKLCRIVYPELFDLPQMNMVIFVIVCLLGISQVVKGIGYCYYY